MPEVITQCTCGQLGVLEAAAGRLAVPVDGPCDACGAEAGEDCRPDCIGQAAHLDELGIDVTACQDGHCQREGCPEHPACDDGEHTYEQHHSPRDHVGPGPCRCDAYTFEPAKSRPRLGAAPQ